MAQTREELALMFYNASFEHLRSGDQDRAITALNGAISYLKLLVIEEGRGDLAKKLAVAFANEAIALPFSDSKIKSYDQAIRILDGLVARDGRSDLAHWYIESLINKGRLLSDLGRLNRASNAEYFASSVEQFTELRARAIDVCECYAPQESRDRELGNLLISAAQGWAELNEVEKARMDAERGIEVLRSVYETTSDPRAKENLEQAIRDVAILI